MQVCKTLKKWVCINCGPLPVKRFNIRRDRGTYQNRCKECSSDYHKIHYKANKQAYLARAKIRNKRLRLANMLRMLRYLKQHPCKRCGITDPVVLQFHHLKDKDFSIGAALACKDWDQIREEIKKCVVLCANCHIKVHAKESGWMRGELL